MRGRKDEGDLLADVRSHTQWVQANLDTLQLRDGAGVQGKIRQDCGGEERRVYMWFRQHTQAIEASKVVTRVLAALDAAVVLLQLGEGIYPSYLVSSILSTLKDMLASGVSVETSALMEESLRSLDETVEHAFGGAM